MYKIKKKIPVRPTNMKELAEILNEIEPVPETDWRPTRLGLAALEMLQS